MKITGVKVSILESDAPERMFDLGMLQGQLRERWMNAATQRVGQRPPSSGAGNSGRKAHELVMHVETDEGVEGICTGEDQCRDTATCATPPLEYDASPGAWQE